MKQITTENGNAKLIINETSFENAIALQTIIFEEAKKLNRIDIGDMDISDAQSLLRNNIVDLINTSKDMFLMLMTSKSFMDIMYKCLQDCTYNDIGINKNLFDENKEARKDLYEIFKECLEVNLSPFAKSLSSQLSKMFKELTQKSDLDTDVQADKTEC